MLTLIWKNIAGRRAQSLLIAVLTLFGRFNALARERRKEIGLLWAMGLRKGQVFCLIIGETCTMALMGGLLGIAAGVILSVSLGFPAAVTPALKSAAMDPQTAITQGNLS